MAKASFKKIGASPAVAETPVASPAAVAVPAAAPAPAPAPVEESDDQLVVSDSALLAKSNQSAVALLTESAAEGEITAKDMNVPRINIVQGVGPLSKLHKAGVIVSNKLELPQPVRIVVLRIRKQWVEKHEKYQANVMPKIVDTEQEVYEAGGTIDGEKGKQLYTPLATALVLIKLPKGAAGEYATDDGDVYGRAIWHMKSTAYSRAAKALFTDARAAKATGRGLYQSAYLLSTSLETFNTGNSTWVPSLMPDGDSTPTEQEIALAAVV